jgi:hypothetical protein
LNLIVWAKTNAGMGSLYRSQHELLPLFKKGTAPHVNNVELGKRGRWRSNVWIYPGASSLGSDARRGLKDHPTVKPTAMLEDALLDLSNRGDIVIDPFLGSGSTLIAADKTGRVCRGVELDPLYVDVIVRRYEAVTTWRFWSRPARPWRRWPRVGRGKQRRSRTGSRGAPSGNIKPWKRRRRHSGCPHSGGQRFESPQLHQEVGANRRDLTNGAIREVIELTRSEARRGQFLPFEIVTCSPHNCALASMSPTKANAAAISGSSGVGAKPSSAGPIAACASAWCPVDR